jgi:hypothetical protein
LFAVTIRVENINAQLCRRKLPDKYGDLPTDRPVKTGSTTVKKFRHQQNIPWIELEWNGMDWIGWEWIGIWIGLDWIGCRIEYRIGLSEVKWSEVKWSEVTSTDIRGLKRQKWCEGKPSTLIITFWEGRNFVWYARII